MYTPLLEYNSTVHTPVLNVLSPLTPAELTIENVGGEFCQEINISQDGLSSYLDSSPFVCGSDGEVSITITNPNSDPDQNKYIDLSAGFETCETENLVLTQVLIGTTSLPVSIFSWVGNDLLVDFSALPIGVDIDGAGGLDDLDGDGVYDNFAGGVSLTLSMFLGIECGVDIPDPSSDICPSNDCSFTQIYISGNTNCGDPFRIFPTGLSGFTIAHGATSVTNPNEYGIPTAYPNLSGYDFGKFGDLGTEATPNLTAKMSQSDF